MSESDASTRANCSDCKAIASDAAYENYLDANGLRTLAANGSDWVVARLLTDAELATVDEWAALIVSEGMAPCEDHR